MRGKKLAGSAVKEALDNLPSGICFFNEKGLPILCNRTMHRLVFALTGRDLQLLSELTAALDRPPQSGVARDGDLYLLPDGTAWHVTGRQIDAEERFTEYVAADVTELYKRKQDLRRSTDAHEKMVQDLMRLMEHVTAITREEENLAMKMQVHGKVGVCLQQLRRYHENGCPEDGKKEIIGHLRQAVSALQGEIGGSDEIDGLTELLRVASTLGVTVSIDGAVPAARGERSLLAMAIRECITNTLRHARGSTVAVSIRGENGEDCIEITNNGAVPAGTIVEGGGLTSLRKQVEKAGGRMEIESAPRFLLRVWLSAESGEAAT